MIDDYGTALVGTNTIDLYKPTKLQMKRWGVRNVDIDILEWGSEEKVCKCSGLARNWQVRKMIVACRRKILRSVRGWPEIRPNLRPRKTPGRLQKQRRAALWID